MFIDWKSARAVVLAAILSVVFPIVAAAASGRAQPLDPDQAFRLEVSRSVATLRLQWTIAPGYYLYRDMIRISAGGAGGPLPAVIGDGVEKDDPTFGPTRIFFDHAEATVAGPAVASTPGAALAITYQGCQDGGICYAPVTRTLDLATLSLAPGEKRLPRMAQSNWQVVPGADDVGAGGIVLAEEESGGMVNALLLKGGVVLVLASYLVFGLALAFTPCVFPMYPILAGLLARSGSALPAKRGFVLSCVYVVAMASAFGLLGIVAAWSGQNLQMALQAPVAIFAVALIFVVLALSMFGFYQLRLPSRWVTAIGGGGRGGGSLRSAALLGATSALIVGPCVTAPLAGALLYIAQRGDGMLGAAALFALGIGKGIPH